MRDETQHAHPASVSLTGADLEAFELWLTQELASESWRWRNFHEHSGTVPGNLLSVAELFAHAAGAPADSPWTYVVLHSPKRTAQVVGGPHFPGRLAVEGCTAAGWRSLVPASAPQSVRSTSLRSDADFQLRCSVTELLSVAEAAEAVTTFLKGGFSELVRPRDPFPGPPRKPPGV